MLSKALTTLPSRTFRLSSHASTSKLFLPSLARRSITFSLPRHDDAQSPELSARELIAAKAKAFELKYGEKLRKKVEEEGAKSLEELKEKKKALPEKPIVDKASPIFSESTTPSTGTSSRSTGSTPRPERRRSSSSPITPLSSILNLPPLLSSPHPFSTISTLWQTLHSAKSLSHPNRFLSATIPSQTYQTMHSLARKHPQFVLPLPREGGGQEFFFLQWAFYEHGESTVIFTSLEEYKLKQGYARPFLTLTHWTDLVEDTTVGASPSSSEEGGSSTSEGEVGAVLMRGEITSTTPPKVAVKLPNGKGEVTPPLDQKERYLLGMSDAQLLLLGLQRFYNLEGSGEKGDREERRRVLEGFTKGTWEAREWEGLKRLAVGSLSGLV